MTAIFPPPSHQALAADRPGTQSLVWQKIQEPLTSEYGCGGHYIILYACCQCCCRIDIYSLKSRVIIQIKYLK